MQAIMGPDDHNCCDKASPSLALGVLRLKETQGEIVVVFSNLGKGEEIHLEKTLKGQKFLGIRCQIIWHKIILSADFVLRCKSVSEEEWDSCY